GTQTIKDAVSALELARSDTDGDGLVGYVLADYLQEYAKQFRSAVRISPELWEIASAGAQDWPTASSLATEAQFRSEASVVPGLLRRTVELGGVGAWAGIACRAADAGDLSILDQLTAVAES